MKAAAGLLLAVAAWLCCVGPASAVRPSEVSITAQAVCLFRAIGAQHPDPKLRNGDDLAERLCGRVAQLPQSYAEARQYLTGSDGKPDGRMPDGHRILQAQVP